MPSVPIEPVYVEVVRACAFKARPLVCREPKCGAERMRRDAKSACPSCGSTRKPVQPQGCVRCERTKHDPAHYGAPPSLNAFGSGDPLTWQAMKERWEAILAVHLEASGLPRGLHRVAAEGEVSFGDATERDQGNFRVLIEKALGDVLQNGSEKAGIPGGWLANDSWSHYEFGNLARVEEGRVSRTRIMLMAWVQSDADVQATLAV